METGKAVRRVDITVLIVLIVSLFLALASFSFHSWRQSRTIDIMTAMQGTLSAPEKNRLYDAVVVFATIPTSEGERVKYFLPDTDFKLQGGKRYATDQNGYPREVK
jgi:hypothetical protein